MKNKIYFLEKIKIVKLEICRSEEICVFCRVNSIKKLLRGWKFRLYRKFPVHV